VFPLAESPQRLLFDENLAARLVLVSEDQDFHRYSVLFGPPPKVIWIGLGNCPTVSAR
jgi:predicted nuclease of predicted toxin-antitoxin system